MSSRNLPTSVSQAPGLEMHAAKPAFFLAGVLVIAYSSPHDKHSTY